MQQIIFGGREYLADNAATEYTSLFGGFDWFADTDKVYQVVAAPGKISKLVVWISTPSGAGKSRTFTLYKNGAATALTVTITGVGDTREEDVTNEVSVSAGDRICIQHVPAGAPVIGTACWAVLFTGSNTGESLLLSNGEQTLNDGFLGYLPAASGGARLSAAGFRNQPVPTPGKITRLYCHMSEAPDPGGLDGYVVTLQVNGVNSDDGLGNPLQVTITGDDVSGNDVRDITLAAGDLIRMTAGPTGAPVVEPYLYWGFCFVPDTDGESIILGNSSDALHNVNTEYNCLACWSILPLNVEGNRSQILWAMTLKRFYVWIKDAPGVGNSYQFTLRKVSPIGGVGAATPVVVTIAGADQTGEDTVNEAAFIDYDGVDFEVDPDSTPVVATATSTGIVSFIAPAAGGQGASMADTLVKAAII